MIGLGFFFFGKRWPPGTWMFRKLARKVSQIERDAASEPGRFGEPTKSIQTVAAD